MALISMIAHEVTNKQFYLTKIFADTSLDSCQFPDISRSSRQVVTLLLQPALCSLTTRTL